MIKLCEVNYNKDGKLIAANLIFGNNIEFASNYCFGEEYLWLDIHLDSIDFLSQKMITINHVKDFVVKYKKENEVIVDIELI